MATTSSVNFLLLILIAALWASMNARMVGFVAINQRRDVILSAHIDRIQITMEHRQLIFDRDWKPLSWGIACVSFLFSFIVVLIPRLLPESEVTETVWLLCFVVAAFHAISGTVTLHHFIVERSFIAAKLAEECRAHEPAKVAS
jgi:hypothetical protein